jgi:hypothetical protein
MTRARLYERRVGFVKQEIVCDFLVAARAATGKAKLNA